MKVVFTDAVSRNAQIPIHQPTPIAYWRMSKTPLIDIDSARQLLRQAVPTWEELLEEVETGLLPISWTPT